MPTRPRSNYRVDKIATRSRETLPHRAIRYRPGVVPENSSSELLDLLPLLGAISAYVNNTSMDIDIVEQDVFRLMSSVCVLRTTS